MDLNLNPGEVRCQRCADLHRIPRHCRPVLDLLSTGYTNASIAQQLVLTTRTVEHYITAAIQEISCISPDTNRRVNLALWWDAHRARLLV